MQNNQPRQQSSKLWAAIGLLMLMAMTACAPAATTSSNSTTGSTTNGSTATTAVQDITFTDARDGKPLKISDFKGKTVVIEAMAAWCSNCLNQQRQVIETLKQIDPATIVYISLGVDSSEDAALLAAYAEKNGFTWRFAVSNPELTKALVEQFDRSVTNPSAVPIFFVRPDGTFSELYRGGHSTDELVKLIQQYS